MLIVVHGISQLEITLFVHCSFRGYQYVTKYTNFNLRLVVLSRCICQPLLRVVLRLLLVDEVELRGIISKHSRCLD